MIAWKRGGRLPIGLFLDERSATAVQLAGGPTDYEVHAMAQGDIPYDEHAPTETQDEERASALRKLIGDHHFKGREVVGCLGSGDLFVQNVRIPQLPSTEIRKVVHWEAEERLPYPVVDAEIRHITAGEVRQDASVKQEVILLASQRSAVDRHVGVLEKAGLMPVGIDVEPCAMLRCLRSVPRERSAVGRVAYLNLGTRATTVLFAEGDRVLFLKYVSTGSNHLDQAVARHLDLNLSEAARMRASVYAAAQLDDEDELHRSVIDAIRGPLETLAAEIELCLRYHKVTFRGKPLERIVVTGHDASGWLTEFLSDRLSTSCHIGNPFEALHHWPPSSAALDRPWRWTTAMGLSMKRRKGA